MSLSEAYTEKPEMDWKDKMALEYDCDRWENILIQVCLSKMEKDQVTVLFNRIRNEIEFKHTTNYKESN